jgi:hypothetical protein
MADSVTAQSPPDAAADPKEEGVAPEVAAVAEETTPAAEPQEPAADAAGETPNAVQADPPVEEASPGAIEEADDATAPGDGATAAQNEEPAEVPEAPQQSVAAGAPASTEVPEDTAAPATLTVRFTVQPENFFFTQLFAPTAPGSSLYDRVERMFRVERHSLRIFWEGRPLAESDVLCDVCVIPDDDRLNLELEFDVTPEFLRMVNAGEQVLRSIEVPVHYGDDVPSRTFFVTMTKAFDRKPFLGGFRNKKSGDLYHHAMTQSHVEREAKRDTTGKHSRVTQTLGVTRSVQTRRECGTQMSRTDIVVDTTFDRVMVAKPYFSAADLLSLQIQKAMKLQAFVRGWRARKKASAMRAERDAEENALYEEDERRRQAHQRKRQEEIRRRTHPRSAKDFAVLYNELEAWRLQETQRIHEAKGLTEAERRVALQELLKKETKLLQTIDRLQIHANQENKVTRINKRLDKMSSAKTWGATRSVQVETPSTIRARELKDLYNGLLLNGLSIDERLDVLLHVKWTVKEFDCPLTRDIVELIDREADLLNRGRKDGTLSQLRGRTANLFLQFIDTPEFNPEALTHQTVPLEYKPRPHVQLTKK